MRDNCCNRLGTTRFPFQYVLNAVWFASAENMVFSKQNSQKDFVMPLKANRKVALSLEDKLRGKYVRVDTLVFEDNTPKPVYLEGVPSRSFGQQSLHKRGGSTGVLSSNTSVSTRTYLPRNLSSRLNATLRLL